MPIYSLTYLNTSPIELSPHLYHCMGSMRSEVELRVPGTRPPTQQRDGDSRVLAVLSWPLLGVGESAAPFCTYRSFVRHMF